MRVLVCGSRTFNDWEPIRWMLTGASWQAHALLADRFVVIHGGAKGADRIAGQVMDGTSLGDVVTYPADWRDHSDGQWCAKRCFDRDGARLVAGPTCYGAGLRRNLRMLDEGKPDVVFAFVDKPLARSRGTADMVRRAKAAGVPVYVVEASR